jgi:hypothetical protein
LFKYILGHHQIINQSSMCIIGEISSSDPHQIANMQQIDSLTDVHFHLFRFLINNST